MDCYNLLQYFSIVNLILNIGDNSINVSKAKKKIFIHDTATDNTLTEYSNAHIEEGLDDTDEDLSTQKYGSVSDHMKKRKKYEDINEDTSLIATEDDSSIDSYSLSMNDNISKTNAEPHSMSIAEQYLGELH